MTCGECVAGLLLQAIWLSKTSSLDLPLCSVPLADGQSAGDEGTSVAVASLALDKFERSGVDCSPGAVVRSAGFLKLYSSRAGLVEC